MAHKRALRIDGKDTPMKTPKLTRRATLTIELEKAK